MKTKNKKGIGILLAAIMVASVFAMMAPTGIGEGITPLWTGPWPEKNISVDKPANLSCVHGTINVSWVWNSTDPNKGDPAPLEMVYIGISKDCDTCINAHELQICDPGCTNYEMDLTSATWSPYVSQCNKFCVLVWNGSLNPKTATYLNGTMFTYDAVDPCIENCRAVGGTLDASDNQWFNGTTPAAIWLNATACDACCDAENVTANVSAISSTGTPAVTFTKVGTSDKTICEGDLAKRCPGDYYDKEIGSLIETNVQNITVVVTDNSTSMTGNNTAECNIRFGIDKQAPEKPEDPCCNSEPGAIRVCWDAVADQGPSSPSGVKEYNVYYRDETAGATEYTYRDTIPATASGSYSCGGSNYDYQFNFTSAMGTVGNNYTFKINATDYALNRGDISNATESQNLQRGLPTNLELTLKDEVYYACGEKQHDHLIANVTDEFGVAVPDIDVCVESGDLHLYPLKNQSSTYGLAYFSFWKPEVPGNRTMKAWVCGLPSINDTKTIYFKPHQAHKVNLTADPTKIEECENSTITLTLLDDHGRPATWDVAPVTLTITGKASFTSVTVAKSGWSISADKKTAEGKTEGGIFQAILHCDGAPDTVTVKADVGGKWFPEVTVIQLGPVTEFCMDLSQGRNDISIPLWPKDNGDYNSTCENVLASLGLANVQSVYHYDAAEEEWLVWLYGGTVPGEEALTHMVPGKGYQVYMNASGTLCINGTFLNDIELLPAEHKLVKGWNMIGFHSLNTGIEPEEYIAGRGAAYTDTGIEYQEPLWTYHAGYRSTGSTTTAYNKQFMKPGWGYWVYVTNDGGTIIPHWEE